MLWMSRATSVSSCSRLGGVWALFNAAMVSFVASMGPPGSASEIAIPATKGARTTRDHSSSVKSLFVVIVVPSGQPLLGIVYVVGLEDLDLPWNQPPERIDAVLQP